MSDSLSPELSAALHDQLQLLRDTYAARLDEKVSLIREAWSGCLALEDGPARKDALTALHRQTHSLAGSGATFGFEAVSLDARRMEIILKEIIAADGRPGPDQVASITDALKALETAALSPQAAAEFETGELTGELAVEFGSVPERLVYLMASSGEEPVWARSLEPFGYQVRVLTSPAALRAALSEGVPSVIIADCIVSPLDTAGEGGPLSSVLFETGRQAEEPVPLVWTCRQGDLETRLEAVRLGGAAFFSHPVDVDALIATLDELTTLRTPEPCRVMIVDDEPALARLFSLILRQAGLMTTIVNDPLKVMEPLVNFRPDLILMDIHMPGCSGTELATVIRQQEAYIGIPIVFLSVESDLSRQMEAMRQGGDDFLLKPVQPRHLVEAITTRAARARSMRSLMMRDSLTGLLNHTKTKDQLAVELDRARRLGHPITLVMIDLDHFKAVNDTHGHSTGDRVLRSLSRLLGQRLRQTDVIGRYGGEEFAVILNGTDARNGLAVIESIRRAFMELAHFSNGKEFRVTFSCGIATSPPHFDSDTILQAADRALYEAKRRGRNRTEVSSDDYLLATKRQPL